MVLARGRVVYSGQEELVGGPRSLKIMDMSSISPFAWNSGSFKRSSANMQPTDHRSTAVEYVVAPSRISGALIHFDENWVFEIVCRRTDTKA